MLTSTDTRKSFARTGCPHGLLLTHAHMPGGLQAVHVILRMYDRLQLAEEGRFLVRAKARAGGRRRKAKRQEEEDSGGDGAEGDGAGGQPEREVAGEDKEKDGDKEEGGDKEVDAGAGQRGSPGRACGGGCRLSATPEPEGEVDARRGSALGTTGAGCRLRAALGRGGEVSKC